MFNISLILQGEYWKPLPLLIFGGLSFSAGLSALFFPETLGRRLPETIEEGENLHK